MRHYIPLSRINRTVSGIQSMARNLDATVKYARQKQVTCAAGEQSARLLLCGAVQ